MLTMRAYCEELNSSWWDRARDECRGVILPLPEPKLPEKVAAPPTSVNPGQQSKAARSVKAERSVEAMTGGAKPAPDSRQRGLLKPEGDKVYRPGERLERQAREFARKTAPLHSRSEGEQSVRVAKVRRERNYDALIARVLDELGI
jgi:hypothetical protein